MTRFRRDGSYAVHCWQEFFRGSDSEAAEVAGETFNLLIRCFLGIFEKKK
jgi:hypothetical protein